MADPYRVQCQECDVLRRIKAKAKTERRARLFDYAWQFMIFCCVVGLFVVIGFGVRGYAARPDPPEVCHETAEVISINGTTRICNVGGTMTTEVLPRTDGNPQVLVRCRCGQDAGRD